jgi:hypothetical protein
MDEQCARVESARVHLMAPARWKSAGASTGRIDRTVRMPAPAQWMRSRVVAHPRSPVMPSPSAPGWLLPPAWPLDRCHVIAVAGFRRLASVRIVPWLRVRATAWLAQASAYPQRLAAGVAIGAVAVAALLLLGMNVPHREMPAPHAGTPAAIPARHVAAVRPTSTAPVLVTAAPAPVIEPAASSTARPRPFDADRRFLSDVSTLDLMLPIDEPDLDISSRQSLWSEVGKASGVDPLLLYAIALVESKALYPDGRVAPTPWLFRVNDHLVRGDRHDVQMAMAAASQFGSGVQDVGIMQVYYPMHRDAVRDPLTLLNPRTNITVAARILRDGMHETRDRVLGVGYYHSHTPTLARDYGTAVLTVYQRLKALHRKPSRE